MLKTQLKAYHMVQGGNHDIRTQGGVILSTQSEHNYVQAKQQLPRSLSVISQGQPMLAVNTESCTACVNLLWLPH